MKFKLTRDTLRGPWAGLPVAWDMQHQFDEETFRHDLALCGRSGAQGIYTGGSTGEFYAMEFDEFKRVATAAIEVGHENDLPVIIGCTSTYTLGAARRAAFAAEAGADGIQVALPYWLEVGDDQLLPFYCEVAGAAPGLALSIYETRRCKKTLTVSQHRAVKEAVPDYLMVKANAGTLGCSIEGCRALSRFINVFAGEREWAVLGPADLAGCCSCMIYWFPRYMQRFWREVEAKDWAAVARRDVQLTEFYRHFHAVADGQGLADSGYDRLGSRIIPYLSTSLHYRGPYSPATESQAENIRNWCRDHCPEMLEAL